MKSLLLLIALSLGAFPLIAQESGDPFEPTVTREEGAFLANVMKVYETDPKEAIRLLLEERPDDADSPALEFTLGNLYFQQDCLEEAADAYRNAIEKMPRFRSALMNLGRVLLLQKKPEETIEIYQQLVRDGQADADILLLLGHAMLLQDSPVAAETAYRQALLLRPRDGEIRLGLAKTLLRQERYREGLALVDEILNRDPLNRELWSLRVSALLSDQKTDRAIRAIEQARRLERATPEMLATLGDLWINADRPEDALDAYREAFAVEEPSLNRMVRALEGFLMVDDPDGARAMVTSAMTALEKQEDAETELRLLGLRAELALSQDQPDEALNLLTELLNRNPLNGRALLTLSDLQAREGDIELALLTAERAARVDGFEARGLLQQAQLEVARGNYARAVPMLESAQAFEPKDAVARYLSQIRRLAE